MNMILSKLIYNNINVRGSNVVDILTEKRVNGTNAVECGLFFVKLGF